MSKCLLLTLAPFPKGNVSTVRYTSYLLALKANNVESKVVIYSPTTMAAHVTQTHGIYKGISYEYATIPTWKKSNPSLVSKIFYLIIGLLNSIKIIGQWSPQCVILYGDNSFIVTLFFYILCKIKRIPYYGDRSEYPSIKIRSSRFRLWLYKKKNSLFNGLIVMTHELSRFYFTCSKKLSLFLLPMTIDCSRFDSIKEDTNERYIAVVFGTHNRDGLYESIQSYIKYRSEYNGTFRLKLIGDFYNMPNQGDLNALIDNYKEISCDIDILGKVDILEVPSILRKASCLLSTPNTYVSGGFPTKLGEYMLSRTPIVFTKAGEIEEYLSNWQDAVLADPGDIDGIASALYKIETNPVLAKQIGINAEKKAKDVFNAASYTKELVRFLNLK